MLEFTLPVPPVPQERPRFTRTGIAYKSATQKVHDRELEALLRPYAPTSPADGPVGLELTFGIRIPASTSKRMRAAMLAQKTPHARKPDLDNLCKELLDCMTRLHFWHDDGQVFSVRMEKRYADPPFIRVLLFGGKE